MLDGFAEWPWWVKAAALLFAIKTGLMAGLALIGGRGGDTEPTCDDDVSGWG